MSTYSCDQCDMEIKGLVCNKCECDLVHKTIDKNGKKVEVAQCPECEGMIKSPQCCGHDMKCER